MTCILFIYHYFFIILIFLNVLSSLDVAVKVSSRIPLDMFVSIVSCTVYKLHFEEEDFCPLYVIMGVISMVFQGHQECLFMKIL